MEWCILRSKRLLIQLWAAILFWAVFIGFAVMSGFSINAYRTTYSFQGTGIYNDANAFTLNSNSIILFAFILATGFFVSAFYFFLARVFTTVSLLLIYLTASNSFGLQEFYTVCLASEQQSFISFTDIIPLQ